jgi:hypothetical protein
VSTSHTFQVFKWWQKCVDFNRLLHAIKIQFGMCQHIFNKNPNYKISWNVTSWKTLCYMQTDNPCELHSHFYNCFLKVPENFWNRLWLSSDFLMLYSGMTLCVTDSQSVTSMHHPNWWMIQCTCMDAAAFKHSHFSLDVFSNTKTFSSHVFCTIRCHKLLWVCWRISLIF